MNHETKLPLLDYACPEDDFALLEGKPVSRRRFLDDVWRAAALLPDQPYAINLCESRYHFAVAFAAVVLRGQTNLLPPDQLSNTLEEISATYSSCYVLSDLEKQSTDSLLAHKINFTHNGFTASDETDRSAEIPAEQVAAILFTSGSTGKPVANAKSWKQLVTGAKLILQRFGLNAEKKYSLVATVPQQHMFGLECALLVPLFGRVQLQSQSPFYPDDVRQALEDAPSPRLLITTPMHLRACTKAGCNWPAIDSVVSATDNLDVGMAAEAEAALSTKIYEIYGCTEAGALATRRTVTDINWRLLPGMTMQATQNTAVIHGPQLTEPVPIQDIVEVHTETEFELLGREFDLIKVAGKRASLADLNIKLRSVSGVEDAVFIAPDKKDGPGARLTAIIVAPDTEADAVLNELGKMLDPVFLPRPLLKVDKLPRAVTGKLPHEALMQLLKQIN